MPEDIELRPHELVENPGAAEPREPQFPPQTPVHAVADAPAGVEQLARTLHHQRHDGPPRCGDPLRVEIGIGRAGSYAVFTRNVETADQPIALEILPEIGELERRAECIGGVIQAWIVVMLFACALLTSCAPAERAGSPTTAMTIASAPI